MVLVSRAERNPVEGNISGELTDDDIRKDYTKEQLAKWRASQLSGGKHRRKGDK